MALSFPGNLAHVVPQKDHILLNKTHHYLFKSPHIDNLGKHIIERSLNHM